MSSREYHLLLVDDDPSAILGMGRMLAQYADQRFATSGEVALRLARELTPDLILLDVDMPGMSGFDVCEALKADPTLARVPVIFVTSHHASAMHVTALQKGAADFVTKPLVAARLTARVRAQLRTKQLLDDLRGARPSGDPDPAPGPPRPTRLLIVDDDTAAIHTLRRTLAAMGELHFAKNGEDALELARRLVPDLILLDAHMPGLDGFDVCRTLKSQAAFRHVPIVFLTRFSDPRYETRALDLGAADFIAKPYTVTVLQARVRNLLDVKLRIDADLQAVRERWRRVGDAQVADIVEAASDAIVSYRTDGEVVLINAAACRMFGVGRSGAIGSSAQALLGADLSRGGDAPAGPARRRLMKRANGESFPVEVSTSRTGEGSDQLTTVMLRDIGDRERLYLGRFESGKLAIDWRPVDTARSTQDAVGAVSAQAEQAGITLSCGPAEASVFVTADTDRLHQCLVYLLTNAIKYNRPGGWARVEVSRGSAEVSIAVRDDGIGMDALQRRHLFEPFNRLGRQGGATPGVGLGMVITRQLVEAMNGRLLVESEPGAGSCFTIVLPAADLGDTV